MRGEPQPERHGGFDATLKPGLRTNNSETGSAEVDPHPEQSVTDAAEAAAAPADQVVAVERRRKRDHG